MIIKNVISLFLNTTIIYYIIAIVTNHDDKPLMPTGYVAKIISLIMVGIVLKIKFTLISINKIIKFALKIFDQIWNNKQPLESYQMFQIQLNK